MPDQWTQSVVEDARGLLPLAVHNALNVVGAIVILIIGIWLAGKAAELVSRMLARAPHFDVMLRSFFGSVARYAVLTITGLAVLSQFGIQTTSIIAVLGAAGLAIGLALQGTLSHMAAGVMLLIFRPFKIGDKVQAGGMLGTVNALSLFWTELTGDDGVQIIVPNGGIWGQPLKNYTTNPVPARGAEARVRIPETADLGAVLDKVRAIAADQPHVLKDPTPTVLFDRSQVENALEIVIGFSAKDGEVTQAKSELIVAVHDGVQAEFATAPDDNPAWAGGGVRVYEKPPGNTEH